MSRLIYGRNSRFPNKGYALIAMMIVVTVILVSLTEALPAIYQQVQREREAEAIFRGEQYARAIYMFHRTLGRFPSSVKELLNTNGTRFLREAYPDPLSPKGAWHFIHANAAGIIIDSQNQTTSPAGQPGTAPGAGSMPQANGTTSTFGAASQMNTSSSGFGSSSQINSSSSSFGAASQTSGQSSGFGQSSPFDESSSTGEQKKKKPPKLAADCRASQESQEFTSGSSSTQTAQSGELLGAYIVGVAPCNLHQTIRVLNKKDHYYQWEFIGVNYVPYALPKVQAVQPSSSFPNSSPGQSQPMGSPPSSGFQGTPNTSSQPGSAQNPGGPDN